MQRYLWWTLKSKTACKLRCLIKVILIILEQNSCNVYAAEMQEKYRK